MDTTILISIVITLLICLIGAFVKATASNNNVKIETRNNTLGNIILTLGVLLGALWPGGMICCLYFGTTTSNIDTIPIYKIDDEYITYTDNTHTPCVYVQNDDIYEQIKLPDAIIHESDTSDNYYTTLTTTKSWLFYKIKDYKYEIYLNIKENE